MQLWPWAKRIAARRRIGFTLLELLVVVGMIAVLTSLVLPAGHRAKFAAKNTVCRNNLRQLGLALNVYISDHGVYPLVELGSGTTNHQVWWQVIGLPLVRSQAYVREDSELEVGGYFGGVFHCPLNVGVDAMSNDPGEKMEEQRTPSVLSYAYNAWGTGTGLLDGLGLGAIAYPVATNQHRITVQVQALRESKVKAPSDMLAFGDGFNRSSSTALDGAQSVPPVFTFGPHVAYQGAFLSRTPYKRQASFRNHRGRFNQAFCDGHVEQADLNGKYSPSDEHLKRWNNDHEPHRDKWASVP
jgi:prepilin-type processing-associated H-X9-DG protein